ncbi:hypothetical protein BDN67DRAFT_969126 [Paxillus ammoniavirescens]|nr:hypothetical protein BDN67DRAFT_969126 [Paxillus ammoniavirescens]
MENVAPTPARAFNTAAASCNCLLRFVIFIPRCAALTVAYSKGHRASRFALVVLLPRRQGPDSLLHRCQASTRVHLLTFSYVPIGDRHNFIVVLSPYSQHRQFCPMTVD